MEMLDKIIYKFFALIDDLFAKIDNWFTKPKKKNKK
jgi:hypothetical protein